MEKPARPTSWSALPLVLTVDLVAEVLGLDRKTVYSAIQRGELPGTRVGGRIIIDRDSLVECLRQGRVVPTRKGRR
jgi:excisionase family DNA binding protein